MKKIKRTNFRVVVEPKRPFICSTQERFESLQENDCMDIVEDIKRHADNFASIEVEWDDEPICSYCDLAWDNLQVCCGAAGEEARKKAKND